MPNIMSSPLYNAQLLRSIGVASYQGAEIGECLEIANLIQANDHEGWYQVWKKFADKNMQQGNSLKSKGLLLDARFAYLRACTYYRTCFFFLEDHPEDERIETAMQQSIDAFHLAIDLFEYPVKKIQIPFEDINLLGYLYLQPQSSATELRPIIIDTGGGDGTKEESYFNVAADAMSHGLHCLTIEGPGQGSILRLQKRPFIRDWERVIEKVVDYVGELPNVDQKKIILIGRSFGGYLAARAVTKEKRIAACIVDPGMVESFGGMTEKFKAIAAKISPELVSKSLNEIIEVVMQHDSDTRFMLQSRMWRFGAKTISDLVKNTSGYTLAGLVQDIQCPTLVCDNTLEYITKGQAKIFYDQLQCQKKYVLFTEEEGAGGHCEPVSPRLFQAKVYEWLQDIGIISAR